ncbi:glycoside hydrolase family 3 N-terminal domain-containing protein [Sodalis sp. RH16]|uniref:glycoside hydrolase family 3 protein n=1 Tax=Sodalis sp. RH16 TaxID=3394331 RepID=UPI0039B43B14
MHRNASNHLSIGKNLTAASQSDEIVAKMTLKEKIGQKIMLDFRYWREDAKTNDKKDMVQLTATITKIIRNNFIGGIILFANNLKDKEQIQKLTDDLRGVMPADGIPLFIATDNEGGSVFRLPRGEFSAFPGNMALGAAVAGTGDNKLAYRQGCVIARDLSSLGINTIFAPVMDVNSNPNNPVINVRSFGDDPASVGRLAREMIAGIGSKSVVSVAKHFPGHGDTVTDSHFGLPMVNKNRQDANEIDLAPYRDAIASDEAPDMIMTAHIRYPALDDTTLKNKAGKEIVRPATLSGKIQTDILRGELGFKGVTITDALDMKAISDNFDIHTVMQEVFKAGVDIALMPVRIYCAEDEFKLKTLIEYLAKNITDKVLDEKVISASVSRIIDLKLDKNIITPVEKCFFHDEAKSRKLEREITDNSITLLKNAKQLIPLKNEIQSIFILMPRTEQGAAIEYTLRENGYHSVLSGDLTEMTWLRNLSIRKYDILIIGGMSDSVSEGENVPGLPQPTHPGTTAKNKIQDAIITAKAAGKKVIYLSLKTPYDVVDYHDKADAVLVTYSFYASKKGSSPDSSLNAAAEIIIGKLPPRGKLPVNIYNANSRRHVAELKYPRGFGLTN